MCVCVCLSNLEFHVSIGLLRAELHLFFELLQCHICLLDLLPLALSGSVQLALHLPSNPTHIHTHTHAHEHTHTHNAIADQKYSQLC